MDTRTLVATPDPIAAWHTEHISFNRLLDLMKGQLDVFHSGQRPNYDLMLDIISYLRAYSDAFHHPREDAAFALLAKRCPDMELELARLSQEHRVIANAGETLLRQLNAILSDAVVPRADVEAAAATYLVYYRNHIAMEEKDVLARAALVLTPQDWEAVKAAAPSGPDPLFGIDPKTRYRDLRRRIALET